MISYRCKSAQDHADALKALLEAAGFSVFVCSHTLRAGEGYRSRIAQTAALCKVMVPLVDEGWADSGECAFEYNVAVRTNLVTKTRPSIIPVALPDIQAYLNDPIKLALKFPLLLGIASNSNLKFLCAAGLSSGEALTKLYEPVAEAILPALAQSAPSPSTMQAASTTPGPANEGSAPPSGWGAVEEWEGYFVDYRDIDLPDGTKTVSGAKNPIQATVMLLDCGSFTARGRDDLSTFELVGMVDPHTGAVNFTKRCSRNISAAVPCDGCGLKTEAVHQWNIFYQGSFSGHAFSGRWGFYDAPFNEMKPVCYWSMWPREGFSTSLADWFARVQSTKVHRH